MKKILIIFLVGLMAFVKPDHGAYNFKFFAADSALLIFIQGESNASGQALNSTAPPAQIGVRSKVQIQPNTTGAQFTNLNIAATSSGGNNQLLMNSGALFGLELALANQIDSGFLPNPTYIVKAGVGGSDIADWLPGGSQEPVFRFAMDSAIAQMNRRGIPYRIFVWQSIGINDEGHGTNIDSFGARMARYPNYLRVRYGRPDIRVLATRFSNSKYGVGGYDYPYVAKIDAIPATDAGFHSIPCDGATYISGQAPIHWDLNGLGTIAHNMMDTMLSLITTSSTIGLSFTPLTTADVASPGRGAEQWQHEAWNNSANQGVNNPAGNSTIPATNYYTRFAWKDIESDVTAGSYSWTTFDQRMHQAMDMHQMFSFSLMPICSGCDNSSAIPTYLHNLMQAETVKDWFYNADSKWVPNWNSPSYRARYLALMQAVKAHIDATSYQPGWASSPISYTKVVYIIDIRGYGNYGEWHSYPWSGAGMPTNLLPTAATCQNFIDDHLQTFPDYQATILIGAFTNTSASFVPAQASYYALTASNNVGQIGWRKDNWGDGQYSVFLENNPETFNGVALKDLIMNKWKFAPITGEPNHWTANPACGSAYCHLLTEFNLYHASMVGNGNFGDPTSSVVQSDYQTAIAATGYRMVLTGGSMTNPIASSSQFNVQVNWSNTGLAPSYEDWVVKLELRNPSTHAVIWSGTSTFNPKLLPGTPATQSDNFTLGSVANGTYDMYMGVTDKRGYKLPMVLAITGRGSDGYYLIRSGVTIGGTANTPPTAVINGLSNITSPTASVALNSSPGTTDPDGSIASYLWSQVSGPNTASNSTPTSSSTTMGGMITGTYVFKLVVTDNEGATGSAFKIVNVDNANISPVAIITPSPPISVQLPTTSTTLTSASTDADGTISTYAWSFISGPNTPIIVTSTASSTLVSGLIAGTYKIQLTVTDNSGGTGTVQTDIIVTAPLTPPTAVINGSTVVTYPINSVFLDGSTSFATAGATITIYQWGQLPGGPNVATIQTPTASTTNISNLLPGTYNFQLQVFDNFGGNGTTTITIVVNAPLPSAKLTVFTTQAPGGNLTGFVTQTPATAMVNDGPGNQVNLGVKFRSTIATNVLGMKFFKQNGNNGTHTGQLYTGTGTLLATGNFVNETANGWQTIIFSSPVAISANTTYIVSYYSPLGTYAETDNYFTAAVTHSTLSLLANGTDGANGVYKYNAGATFPTDNNGLKSNYWVDVIVASSGVLITAAQGINLGMKFRSSVDAYVTGTRFFKIAGNNGTHVGELYTSTGTRLATAVYSNETASGWQTATFDVPVLITAGVTYVISYFSPLGTYNQDDAYFSAAVVNSTITGLADGTDGANGVFTLAGVAAFPSSNNGLKSNYWVDVNVSPYKPCVVPTCIPHSPYGKAQ